MAYYVELYPGGTASVSLPLQTIYEIGYLIENGTILQESGKISSGNLTGTRSYTGNVLGESLIVDAKSWSNAIKEAVVNSDYDSRGPQLKYFSGDVLFLQNAAANLSYFQEIPTSTPLATPTGLYADNITSDSARTNWQAVENASNYKVQYKAAGDTVWTETYTD